MKKHKKEMRKDLNKVYRDRVQTSVNGFNLLIANGYSCFKHHYYFEEQQTLSQSTHTPPKTLNP